MFFPFPLSLISFISSQQFRFAPGKVHCANNRRSRQNTSTASLSSSTRMPRVVVVMLRTQGLWSSQNGIFNGRWTTSLGGNMKVSLQKHGRNLRPMACGLCALLRMLLRSLVHTRMRCCTNSSLQERSASRSEANGKERKGFHFSALERLGSGMCSGYCSHECASKVAAAISRSL